MSTKAVKESRPSYLADAANELIASASGSPFDAEIFFEKFELFAETPEAIDKFRQTVLHFAFRGLLTERNGERRDEDLLDKVEADVIALAGKKRSQSKRQMVEPTAWPYDLPETWHWTVLGRIANWGSGSTPTRGNPEFYNGTITWLKSGELNDARDLIGSEEKVTDVALKQCSFRLNQKGDVLFAMYGATVGKVAILREEAVTNQAVCGCTPSKLVNNVFLYYYLISQRQTFRDTSEGGAQPNFSKDKIVSFPFPLPPLAEQKRIVAKVDELMGLCDRLEALEAERKERHASLSRAALARFADSPTPTNLQFLFHKSFDVEPSELRRAILSAGVKGQLFCNSVGLEQTKVGDHIEFQNGYAFKSSWFKPEGIRLCRNMNVSHGLLDWRETAFVDTDIAEEFNRFSLNENDIVLSLDRPLINTGLKVARVSSVDLPCLLLQRVARVIRKHEEIDVSFFYLWLNSPEFTDTIDPGRSNGVPHISTRQVQQLAIWLPPIAEQKRIVAKVDELMALVDQLEQQLAHSRTLGQQLLEAIVANLTANHG